MTISDPLRSSRQLKQGEGWRLGWDPSKTDFPALVGGDRWAFELTAAEFADFCRLTLQLADTLEQMAAELMDEEKICCEAESERIWLEVDGYAHEYELHLIVQDQRQVEGYWQADAVPSFVQAIQTLGVF